MGWRMAHSFTPRFSFPVLKLGVRPSLRFVWEPACNVREARATHHTFNPYFGVGRYVRLIDSSLHFWLNRGAADGSNCEHCDHRTSHITFGGHRIELWSSQ